MITLQRFRDTFLWIYSLRVFCQQFVVNLATGVLTHLDKHPVKKSKNK